jgi:phosphotriesterase-related protein
MSRVQTVLGDVEPSQLGWTMPHEHIAVCWDGALLDSTLDWDWATVEQNSIARLAHAKLCGIDTVIDMTTIEMGRNPALLRRLAEASEIQIICCTGLFADAYGVPHYFRNLSEDELYGIFEREVSLGIGKTGVRAGVIKVATGGREVTPLEERITRAAGRAAAAADVPVLTHTGHGAAGDRQIEILQGVGVSASRIVIGHSDVSANLKYHIKLLKAGVYVGFDRIGLTAFMPDEIRAQCISALVRMGYANQLLMSLDTALEWCGRDNDLGTPRELTYLKDRFLPMLGEAGVSWSDISTMMVTNPQRLFS